MCRPPSKNGHPRHLKSAVLARRGSEIRFNPELLEFSGFYNYEPRACALLKEIRKVGTSEPSAIAEIIFSVAAS